MLLLEKTEKKKTKNLAKVITKAKLLKHKNINSY